MTSCRTYQTTQFHQADAHLATNSLCGNTTKSAMNVQNDATDGTPLNAQAAVEGGYGSTFSSDDGASASHPSTTSDAPLARSVGGMADLRANDSSQNTPANVSQLQALGSSITICMGALGDVLKTVLKCCKENALASIDVTVIVAGTIVLVLHWRDEGSVCSYDEIHSHEHGDDFWDYEYDDDVVLVDFQFSAAWRQWALVAVVLKVLITGVRLVSLPSWSSSFRRERRWLEKVVLGVFGLWCIEGILEVITVDPDSCEEDMDEPIFQLCLAILIISVIELGVNVIRALLRVRLLALLGYCWLLTCSYLIVVLLLLRYLFVGQLQHPRRLSLLYLVVVSLCLLIFLVRWLRWLLLLQRMRMRQDLRRRWWQLQQTGPAGALAPTIDPNARAQSSASTPSNSTGNVGGTVAQGRIGDMLADTVAQQQQQLARARQDQADRLPVATLREEERSGACTICLVGFDNGGDLRRLPCDHVFHRTCVGIWLARNPSCPVCRGSLGEGLA